MTNLLLILDQVFLVKVLSVCTSTIPVLCLCVTDGAVRQLTFAWKDAELPNQQLFIYTRHSPNAEVASQIVKKFTKHADPETNEVEHNEPKYPLNVAIAFE